MCGRYVSPEEAAIEREWNRVRIRNPLGLDSTRFGPNWNVAPTHQVPALRRCEGDGDGDAEAGRAEGGAERVALCWGLISSWTKGAALHPLRA